METNYKNTTKKLCVQTSMLNDFRENGWITTRQYKNMMSRLVETFYHNNLNKQNKMDTTTQMTNKTTTINDVMIANRLFDNDLKLKMANLMGERMSKGQIVAYQWTNNHKDCVVVINGEYGIVLGRIGALGKYDYDYDETLLPCTTDDMETMADQLIQIATRR